MKITEERITELERLLNAATPGPWEFDFEGIGSLLWGDGGNSLVSRREDALYDEEGELIAAMRNLIPDLIAYWRENSV